VSCEAPRESAAKAGPLVTEGQQMTETSQSPPPAGLPGRAKARCRRGAAQVTGADIVRIARTLAVEPWQFTQSAPVARDEPDGIVLDKGRRRVSLTLATNTDGCLFAIRTSGGVGCCGLGELAPVACRIFPADPRANTRPGAKSGRSGAEKGTHPEDGSIDQERLASLRHEWELDQAHWHELIKRWNTVAGDARPAAPALSLPDFQRYLLEAQAAREAGTAWPEEVRP
jgi:hypothetical protein